MKFRAFVVAAVALATLGGCATYDYAAGSAPGGYYSGQPQVEYYGGYGYPYGGYGYPYGYGGYGYYAYPYGGYGYPYGYGGHYYPRYHYGHVPRPRPRPDGGTTQPPPSEQPRQDGRAPWRDLRRIVEEKNRGAVRQTAPRTYQAPQGGQPARVTPMPRPQATPMPRMRSSDEGGSRRARKFDSNER